MNIQSRISHHECAVRNNAAISHQSRCIRRQSPRNDTFDAVKVTERLQQLHLLPIYPKCRLSCHIEVWRHDSEYGNGLILYLGNSRTEGAEHGRDGANDRLMRFAELKDATF